MGPQPMLVAVEIRKQFGALAALDGVDFTVASGEAVGIVGPNGAGKTTLLNVLAGTVAPSSGTVSFQGAAVTAILRLLPPSPSAINPISRSAAALGVSRTASRTPSPAGVKGRGIGGRAVTPP